MLSPVTARVLQLGLVVLAGALPFLPLLDAGFLQWDDPYFVTLQPFWLEPSWDALVDVFRRPIYGAYHPLHQVSYMFDRALWGQRAFGVRLTQALLHGLCAGSVVVLARRLALPWFGALLAGLVFAWHPAHVENVAWLSQRKDLLSALFALLAVNTYLGPQPRGLDASASPPGWGRACAAGALLALGMLSKSVTVVVVPWLCLLAWRRGTLRVSASRLAPLALLGVLAIGLHYRAQSALGAAVGAPPAGQHALRVLRALAYYLQTAVVPVGLSPIPTSPGRDLVGADLGAALTLATFAALLLVSWRRRRWFLLWGAWFVVGLLPTLGIVPLPNFAQDRYLLLPSVPLALVAGRLTASWLQDFPEARRRSARLVLSGALVLGCASSARYARAWRSDLTLWSWNLRQHPQSPEALEKLAYAHLVQYRSGADSALAASARQRAERLCEQALARDPRRLRPNLILSELREEEGRFDAMRPLLERALESGSNVAFQAGLRLSQLELREDRLDAAEAALRRAQALAPPGAPEVAAGEAALAQARGDLELAEEGFRRAVRALPEWRAGWANLALVQRLRGAREVAEASVSRARPSPLGAAIQAQLALDAGALDEAEVYLRSAGVGLEGELGRLRLLLRRGDPGATAALGRLLERAGPGGLRRLRLEPELRDLLPAAAD